MIYYGKETQAPAEVQVLPNFKLDPGIVEFAGELKSEYGLDVIGSSGDLYYVKPEQLALTWVDEENEGESTDTRNTWVQAQGEVSKDYGFGEEDISDQATLAIFGDVEYENVFGAKRSAITAKHYTKEELQDIASGGNAVIVSENPRDPFLKEARLLAKQNDIPLAIWWIARNKL